MLDAGTGGVLRTVEMTIADIRQLANQTLAATTVDATTSTRGFTDLSLPEGAFGGWPEAQALGRHHSDAHEVFVSTVEGVIQDLETFAQNLRDTAEASERQDQAVEQGMTVLGQRYTHQEFSSERHFDRAVEAQGHDAQSWHEQQAAAEASDTGSSEESGPLDDGAAAAADDAPDGASTAGTGY